jgi:hypothetical protein
MLIQNPKSRWSPPHPPFTARIVSEGDALRLEHGGAWSEDEGKASRARALVLEIIGARGEQSRQELLAAGKALGLGDKTVQEALRVLATEDLISKKKSGKEAIYFKPKPSASGDA